MFSFHIRRVNGSYCCTTDIFTCTIWIKFVHWIFRCFHVALASVGSTVERKNAPQQVKRWSDNRKCRHLEFFFVFFGQFANELNNWRYSQPWNSSWECSSIITTTVTKSLQSSCQTHDEAVSNRGRISASHSDLGINTGSNRTLSGMKHLLKINEGII